MLKSAIKASTSPYCVELEPKVYSYCTCGLSRKQPLCDASHKGKTELKSIKFEITEKKKVWLCGCKESSNQPYCDGTHNKL